MKVLLCLLSALQSLNKAITVESLNVIHVLSIVSFSLVYRMRQLNGELTGYFYRFLSRNIMVWIVLETPQSYFSRFIYLFIFSKGLIT